MTMNNQELEKWAERRLAELGVDEVFAPYIVGMLDQSEINQEQVHSSIHEVLMGWLPLDSQVREAMNQIYYPHLIATRNKLMYLYTL